MEDSIYFETVKSYFTANEWDKLGKNGQIQAINRYEIYKVNVECGFNVKPPSFVKKFETRENKEEKRNENEEESFVNTHSFEVINIKTENNTDSDSDTEIRTILVKEENHPIQEVNIEDTIITENITNTPSNNINISTIETENNSEAQSLDDTTIEEKQDDDLSNKNQLEQNINSKEYIVIPGIIKNFICEICEKEFKSNHGLKSHLTSVHATTKSFQCKYCDFSSTRESNIIRHTNTIHFKIKKYKCTKCDFSTAECRSLISHNKRMHLNKFKYKCAHCRHRNYSKKLLTAHMATKHLNLKKCKHCFYYSTDLNEHTQLKHSKNKFKCLRCYFIGPNKESLDRHINLVHVRAEIKCPHCNYHTVKELMNQHILVIHQNRFKCNYDECNFNTASLFQLKQHVNSFHLKLKNYKCNFCEFCTDWSSELTKHFNLVHMNKDKQ